MNFLQLESLFSQVYNILNDRPLSARVFSEDDFQAITPNDLLLGRNPQRNDRIYSEYEGEEVEIQATQPKAQKVIERVESWWQKWQEDVFPLLATRKVWQNVQTNIGKDDIVLVKYTQKFKRPSTCLAESSGCSMIHMGW